MKKIKGVCKGKHQKIARVLNQVGRGRSTSVRGNQTLKNNGVRGITSPPPTPTSLTRKLAVEVLKIPEMFSLQVTAQTSHPLRARTLVAKDPAYSIRHRIFSTMPGA